MTEQHDTAVQCRKLGYRAFPLVPMAKTPRFKNWQMYPATPVNDRYWFLPPRSSNVGVRCENVAVIDIDGPAALNEVRRRGVWSPMVVYSGGNEDDHPKLHLYFRQVEGLIVGNRQRVGKVAGLDVRGKGGYAVAWNSIHPNGKRYTLSPNGVLAPADLPPFPVEFRRESVRQEVNVVVTRTFLAADERKIASARSALNRRFSIAGSGGDLDLFKAACLLVQFFELDDVTCLELLRAWNADGVHVRPSWPDERLVYKVAEARRLKR